MVGQNTLIDHATRLSHCATGDARWSCGSDLLQGIGSAWVTAGTANLHTHAALAIRTTTPDTLMRDYIGERLYLDDPWMAHCAASGAIDSCDPTAATGDGTPRLQARQARLFADHGIRLALLVPSYGGSRPGGIVLYARSPDAARAMVTSQGLAEIRLITALVAAFYRPEDDQPGSEGRFAVHAPLSVREREALLWLSRGMQSAAIAHRMRIGEVTVAKHLHNARRKLGARTREQALAIAVRDRLIAI